MRRTRTRLWTIQRRRLLVASSMTMGVEPWAAKKLATSLSMPAGGAVECVEQDVKHGDYNSTYRRWNRC